MSARHTFSSAPTITIGDNAVLRVDSAASDVVTVHVHASHEPFISVGSLFFSRSSALDLAAKLTAAVDALGGAA